MSKNIAVIFAGGSGKRMNTKSKPKQFLELHGKPIIVYTLELFENHPEMDAIYVACIEGWIPYLQKLIRKFDLTKVKGVVAGGNTGQESIYNALQAAERDFKNDDLVLIHDGVRPLIDDATISDNIETATREGNCITCVAATETLVVQQTDGSLHIPTRDRSLIARAPQTFRLGDILAAHRNAIAEGRTDFIDSCTLMSTYGARIATTIGPSENIKITTPTDFFMFRAIEEVRENSQIFGI
ncbi:MAG: IspD/TarI family cytidylyltransferase [Bacteroidaceae bacterium]